MSTWPHFLLSDEKQQNVVKMLLQWTQTPFNSYSEPFLHNHMWFK